MPVNCPCDDFCVFEPDAEIVIAVARAFFFHRTRLMLCMGIDPGRSGAIAIIGMQSEFVDQCRLSALPEDICRFVERYSSRLDTCVLEKVWSRPGNSARSMFTFGQNFGFVEGVLSRSRIEYQLTTPQTWMRALGCETKGDKNVTKEAAQGRWPRHRIHHWNADALLIAEYARLKFLREIN